MECPMCKQNLIMADRQGVEIDYCPNCRGVWLDRGELDKIIEKSNSIATRAPQASQLNYDQSERHHKVQNDNDHFNCSNTQYNQPHHKKKESWLGDIFDF